MAASVWYAVALLVLCLIGLAFHAHGFVLATLGFVAGVEYVREALEDHRRPLQFSPILWSRGRAIATLGFGPLVVLVIAYLMLSAMEGRFI